MNEQTRSYNPSDFQVDIRNFACYRPLGVSGLMRVKDEAEWVEASIDSCIDALDELVICYQACTDDTPAILERKQRQYPDKIKLYFYAPSVYAHNLSDEEFDYACSLPDDSIHLLSNYYNYTLSKATYRHAIKIDADQIYFTDRLKRLCDAYRNTAFCRSTLVERGAYFYYRIYNCLMHRLPGVFSTIVRFLPAGKWILKHYEGYCLSKVSVGNVSVNLSGINLSARAGKWGVPILNDVIPLYFNGNGDTCLFPVSEHSYYVSLYQTPDAGRCGGKVSLNTVYKEHRIIERFVLDSSIVYLSLGFMWYHMKFAYTENFERKTLCQDMALEKFLKLGASALLAHNQDPFARDRIYHWLFFYDHDKKLPNAPKEEGLYTNGNRT